MMQPWFPDAKLGIFIHWGIYAVKGVAESWSFFNGELSYEEYMSQLKGFTASKYDPDEWAEIFKDAGATYAVLTAKHHDGVALWDTKLSDLNVVQMTPARRDLMGPYCDALRKAGLKVGIYFSHLDWSHPDYPTMFNDPFPQPPGRNKKWAYPQGDAKEDPARWAKFLEFHRGQLKELCERYRPDLLWFDGDWERTGETWKMKELREDLHRWAPGVILNSRMKGHGDYETPEQGVPIEAPPGPWEFCMTINDAWGYKPSDKNFKSTRQIIRYFVDVIGMGGNLLLDIGPKEDGTIQKKKLKRLKKLGAWIREHNEAVFGTTAGLPAGYFNGPSTLSKDRKTLYLYLYDIPNPDIAVKGIKNKIERVSVVGSGAPLDFKVLGGAPWCGVPGVLWVDVPREHLNKYCTAIKVELKDPINLYGGHGKAITQN